MKLRVPLSGVDSRRGACGKPGCDTGSYRLNRHHTRHEYLFISFWVARYNGQTWFKKMVSRYHRFEPEDIVYICAPHHAEIHQIYDKIIYKDTMERKCPLQAYSRQMGEELMERLHDACMTWMETETPGIDPRTFNVDRRTRRKPRRRRKR